MIKQRRSRGLIGLLAVLGLTVGMLAPAAAAAPHDVPDNGIDIVGGEEAAPGAYPFMTALVSSSSTDAYLGQYCGASVVAATWVMTAAHCVERTSPSAVDLVIGRHDLRSAGGERIAAKTIISHPGYNRRTYANDIALIELSSPTTASPVGLADATNASQWAPGTIATVMGWGSTESVPLYPEGLHEVDVPIVSDSACLSTVNVNGLIPEVMICAGDIANGGEDSCGGDSGGPMVVPDGAGGYLEVGIVSWGYGCADANAPGVYTEVAAFAAWVTDTIGDEPPPPPPPPSTGDYELLLSLSADRTGATPLDGATVSGDVYAFVSPGDGIDAVTFTVDGVRPRTDGAAPFDLAGTSRSGDARAYRTGRLGAGSHTVAAEIDFVDGSTETIVATFVVE